MGQHRFSPTFVLMLLAGAGAPTSAVAQAERGIWDGVYTEGQAARGATEYGAACASCHAEDLGGNSNAPSLVGVSFMFLWEDRSLGDLFTTIRTQMPTNAPNSLPAQSYLDILAYILDANEFPAGEDELGADLAALGQISITADAPTAVAPTVVAPVAIAQASSSPSPTWVTLGLGGGHFGEVSLAALAGLARQRGPHLFALRSSVVTDFDDHVYDIGLLYGRGTRGQGTGGRRSVGIGLALVSVDGLTGEDGYTIGVPLAVEMSRNGPNIGLGVQGFANLNSVQSFAGAVVTIGLGRLR